MKKFIALIALTISTTSWAGISSKPLKTQQGTLTFSGVPAAIMLNGRDITADEDDALSYGIVDRNSPLKVGSTEVFVIEATVSAQCVAYHWLIVPAKGALKLSPAQHVACGDAHLVSHAMVDESAHLYVLDSGAAFHFWWPAKPKRVLEAERVEAQRIQDVIRNTPPAQPMSSEEVMKLLCQRDPNACPKSSTETRNEPVAD